MLLQTYLQLLQRQQSMTSTTIANSVYSAPSLNQYEKGSSITIAEIQSLEDENERSFHGTGAAYVLPNE